MKTHTILFALLVFLFPVVGHAASESMRPCEYALQLLNQVIRIQSEKDDGKAADLTENLAQRVDVMPEVTRAEMAPQVVDGISVLLFSDRTTVRMYAADAIAVFGRHAESAIPSLKLAIARFSKSEPRIPPTGMPVQFESASDIAEMKTAIQMIEEDVRKHAH